MIFDNDYFFYPQKPHNEDQTEMNMLVTYHEQIYTELANRHAMLLLIRNSTKWVFLNYVF